MVRPAAPLRRFMANVELSATTRVSEVPEAPGESLAVQLRALAYFRPDAGRVALLVGLLALGALVTLVQAWPVAVLIDSVLVPTPKDDWIHRTVLLLLPSGVAGRLVGLAVLVLVLRVVGEIANMFRTLLGHHVGHAAVLRVRCDLFRKLQAMHPGWHARTHLGDSMQRLSADAAAVQALLTTWISVGIALVTLVVMTVVLASRSGQLTAIALGSLPLLWIVNRRFEPPLRRRSHVARRTDGELSTTIQQALSTIVLTQAFGREAHELERFHASAERSVRAWVSLHRDEMIYFLSVGVILASAAAAIFGYGGWLVHSRGNSGGLGVGDLTLFLAYLGMLFDPLCKLTGAASSLHGGVASARRVFSVLDRPARIVDAPGATSLAQAARRLTLEGVRYQYPGSTREVLGGVDLVIEPGEMVALVGRSGSGKSTLLHLLCRFDDPSTGRVRLGGHDLRSVRVADVRRHVAIVQQEALFIPTSIAENIAYGRPTASRVEIRKAAEQSCAVEFIEALPEGFETRIAEGGKNLSGGQRQRLSLARALLAGAPILVLDEPTSALDVETEARVVEALAALRGRRTLLMVTHRISAAAACDRVVLLEGGRVVAEGPHPDLVRTSERYRELVREQASPVAVTS